MQYKIDKHKLNHKRPVFCNNSVHYRLLIIHSRRLQVSVLKSKRQKSGSSAHTYTAARDLRLRAAADVTTWHLLTSAAQQKQRESWCLESWAAAAALASARLLRAAPPRRDPQTDLWSRTHTHTHGDTGRAGPGLESAHAARPSIRATCCALWPIRNRMCQTTSCLCDSRARSNFIVCFNFYALLAHCGFDSYMVGRLGECCKFERERDLSLVGGIFGQSGKSLNSAWRAVWIMGLYGEIPRSSCVGNEVSKYDMKRH